MNHLRLSVFLSVPSSPSALEGDHSTAPKCAGSAAVIQGSQRCASELFGAYGWQLTFMDGLEESLSLSEAEHANGGVYIDAWTAASLTATVTADSDRDLHWPDVPDIRLARYRLGNRRVYYLVNEGESVVEGPLPWRTRAVWNAGIR